MMAKIKAALNEIKLRPLSYLKVYTNFNYCYIQKIVIIYLVSFSIESLIKTYFKTCKSVKKTKQLIYYLKGNSNSIIIPRISVIRSRLCVSKTYRIG
jgi:hypothetical protein